MDDWQIEIEYQDTFGETPDSRRIPPDVFERLPQLMRMALDRGEALTADELQMTEDPGPQAVI